MTNSIQMLKRIDSILNHDLSKVEMKILLCLLKMQIIADSNDFVATTREIEKLSGIPSSHLSVAIKKMDDKNVLSRSKNAARKTVYNLHFQ